jgi:hypothetical protein
MESHPVLSRESGDTSEVLDIVGDERQPQRKRMRRYERVERADRLATSRKCGCEAAESSGRGLIEGHNFNRFDKGADQAVKLPRLARFSSVAKLREGDRADAELRGAVFQ